MNNRFFAPLCSALNDRYPFSCHLDEGEICLFEEISPIVEMTALFEQSFIGGVAKNLFVLSEIKNLYMTL